MAKKNEARDASVSVATLRQEPGAAETQHRSAKDAVRETNAPRRMPGAR